jgi:hypothetical protein
MPIDDITLLQVNTTAIIGIFIFLTLGRLSRNQPEHTTDFTRWGLTFALLIPFAASALSIMIKDTVPYAESHIGNLPNILTMVGFAYIIVVFTLIYFIMRTASRK